MADEGVTVAQGVPDAVGADAGQRGARRGPTSARCASPARVRRACPRPWWPRCAAASACPVVVRYTSTESSLGTGTTLTSSDEEVATTVGRPVRRRRARHRRRRRATRCPPGRSAGSCCDPRAAMRGYWGAGPGRGRARRRAARRRRPRRAVLAPDGWLTTGDFGRLTPEGNLQLSGRAHERYIRGGYNVYPAEVEEALSSPPRGGPGRGGRRARRRPRRDRRGRRRGRGRRRARAGRCCGRTVPGRSPTTRPPTRWSSSTSCR